MVHHTRDGVEQLLLRHVRIIDAEGERDDAVAVAAVHIHHALNEGILRRSLRAQNAISDQLHIRQAEVVQTTAQGREELAFLRGVGRGAGCPLRGDRGLLGPCCSGLSPALLDVLSGTCKLRLDGCRLTDCSRGLLLKPCDLCHVRFGQLNFFASLSELTNLSRLRCGFFLVVV